MKKIISIVILSILLFNLILAQSPPAAPGSANLTISKISINDPTPKTDNLLEREVVIPVQIKKIVGILLGFNEGEKITWSIMVGILVFMAVIFIILLRAFELISLFEGIMKILGALAVTLLISISKGIKPIVEFYFKITDSVNGLKNWSTGALIFFTIIIIGLMIIFRKITKSLKKIRDIEKAEIDGTKIGWNIATLTKLKDELFKKE